MQMHLKRGIEHVVSIYGLGSVKKVNAESLQGGEM